MAVLTVFAYRPSQTVLHRMDARVKLTAMAVLSIVSIYCSPLALAVATLSTGMALHHIKLNPLLCFRELKVFFLFLIGVFIARAITTPGSYLIEYSILSISREGLLSGALIYWRLTLVILMSVIITRTTPANHVRAVIEWYLKPLPGIPSQKVSILIGLLMRFIPAILMQAHHIDEAQRARGIENRKNPVYRITIFSMALMRITFAMADHLAMAMESRCYGDHPPAFFWQLKPHDVWAMVLLSLLGLAMVVL